MGEMDNILKEIELTPREVSKLSVKQWDDYTFLLKKVRSLQDEENALYESLKIQEKLQEDLKKRFGNSENHLNVIRFFHTGIMIMAGIVYFQLFFAGKSV